VTFLRHGESQWNKTNHFCAWVDIGLSEKGTSEGIAAAKALHDAGCEFDVAHTSLLTRARTTVDMVLSELHQEDLPVMQTWRLNERHYGALTGLNKRETAQKYGEEQVKIWRRAYDAPPPPMTEDHPYYKTITEDPRYRDGPSPDEFPVTESLKMTIERTLPYWNDVIVPQIRAGKRLLIVAHSNSLRGFVKYLDNLNEEEVLNLNIPNCIPFYYDLDSDMKPVTSLQFLADEETVRAKMEDVANQGKAT